MYIDNSLKRQPTAAQTDILDKMTADVRSPRNSAVSFRMQDVLS